ncbi:phosphatase PAP2 family protein [Stomatohabitans albus]|uniref:phosphatase PAP2 family protein n=1 Tax=Stomatohabitans albus TaxID=3110766 RepID=UPI00300CB504
MMRSMLLVNPVDSAITQAVVATRTGLGDIIFWPITTSGNFACVWIVLGALLLGWTWLQSPSTARRQSLAAGLGVWTALALSQLIVEVTIKPLVNRPRPLAINPTWNHLDITTVHSSFPSGHTGWAFAVVPVLWAWDPRAGKAGLAFALLMGFSRIYVGAHWFTDVIAGAAIGTILGIFVVWAIRRLFPSSL